MFGWKAKGRIRLFVSVLVLFSWAPLISYAAEPSQVREGRIKSALLYYLAKFVQWPPESFDGNSPFKLCLLGNDALNTFVESTMKDKTVHGRIIEVVFSPTVKPASEYRKCNVLYFGNVDRESAKRILTSSSSFGILTVSSQPDFTKVGGLVHLFEENNKFRIKINIKNTERAKLSVSSELLQVSVLEGTE